jgi:hypothetical protein
MKDVKKNVVKTVQLDIVDVADGSQFDEVFIACLDVDKIALQIPKAKGRIPNTLSSIVSGQSFDRFIVQRGLDPEIDRQLMLAYLKLEGSKAILEIEKHVHGARLINDDGTPALREDGSEIIYKGNGLTKIGDEYLQIQNTTLMLGAEAEQRIMERAERISGELALAKARAGNVVERKRRPSVAERTAMHNLNNVVNAEPKGADDAGDDKPVFTFRPRNANESKADYAVAKAEALAQFEIDNAINAED